MGDPFRASEMDGTCANGCGRNPQMVRYAEGIERHLCVPCFLDELPLFRLAQATTTRTVLPLEQISVYLSVPASDSRSSRFGIPDP